MVHSCLFKKLHGKKTHSTDIIGKNKKTNDITTKTEGIPHIFIATKLNQVKHFGRKKLLKTMPTCLLLRVKINLPEEKICQKKSQ